MKICLIGTVASSSLNFRRGLIRLLKSEGHEVHVFATDYTESTKTEVRNLGGIPIDYQLNRGGLNPLQDIKSTIQLKKLISDIAPDIVFSYFSKPVIFASIAARLAKVPRVVGMLEGLGYTFTKTNKEGNDPFKKTLIKNVQILLYKLSFKHLERLIFLNSDDAVDLIKQHNLSVKDVKILGGIGVDLEKFPYTPPSIDPVRFLFIGRLLKEKGIYEYISAVKIVKASHPRAEFIVLGGLDKENPSGLTQAELDALLQDGTIIYPGHVDNVNEWIQRSSVFVLPSYREGVPCSTQEAMASGRAIITTDVPGCRETVSENVNGFIVPAMDHQKIAEKMIFFLDNPEKLEAFGNSSRDISEIKFDSRIQNKNLRDLILEK